MALWDEDTTWVALDGADYNKTITVTDTASDVTITGLAAGTGAIQVWATVDSYITVTEGAAETTATANSFRLQARVVEEWPVNGASVTVSALRMGSVSGSVYVSTKKLA